MAVPVVLDVDTGVDDALALLLAAAHPGLDLRAVSCVAGNAPVDQVVANTLLVLDEAGATGVPVARGADRPLLEPPRPARHVHGEDGLGDLGRPPSARTADPRPAVEMLRDVLTAEPVTLIALAPLTNIALLARTYPDAFAGLQRLVFMGGGALRGNATASAEFNVWHDPEAAAIVLAACAEHAVPVTMYGLDVFYEPLVTPEQAATLPADGLARGLLEFAFGRYGEFGATIGDAGAVAVVADPSQVTTVRLPVRVELAGRWTRGETVVDQRDSALDHAHDPHGAGTVVDVAMLINGPYYAQLWLDAVS